MFGITFYKDTQAKKFMYIQQRHFIHTTYIHHFRKQKRNTKKSLSYLFNHYYSLHFRILYFFILKLHIFFLVIKITHSVFSIRTCTQMPEKTRGVRSSYFVTHYHLDLRYFTGLLLLLLIGSIIPG